MSKKYQIISESLRLIVASGESGRRYSDLVTMVEVSMGLRPSQIRGIIWDLDKKFPQYVSKPEKGLFRWTGSEVNYEALLAAGRQRAEEKAENREMVPSKEAQKRAPVSETGPGESADVQPVQGLGSVESLTDAQLRAEIDALPEGTRGSAQANELVRRINARGCGIEGGRGGFLIKVGQVYNLPNFGKGEVEYVSDMRVRLRSVEPVVRTGKTADGAEFNIPSRPVIDITPAYLRPEMLAS